MTLNVYHGVDAELAAVLTPPPPNLFEKVAAVYLGYFQRNFPERASAFAAEIEAKQPDLIGLQEAILVRTQSPPDGPGTPAATVALDFVQILLNALTARGLHYEVAVQAFNSDRELPSDGTGATYNDLIDAGFGDAVVEAGTGSTPTCCQAANLLNAASILDHRSDYILFREGFTVLDAEVSGEEPGDKTPSGLWPSDHAGVAARLELPQP